MECDRVFQMEQIIRNTRDDRFLLSERKRIVFPELVPERSTDANEIELVRLVSTFERIDERFFGVTDDRGVVSDRLSLFEGFCCFLPGSVDVDV